MDENKKSGKIPLFTCANLIYRSDSDNVGHLFYGDSLTSCAAGQPFLTARAGNGDLFYVPANVGLSN